MPYAGLVLIGATTSTGSRGHSKSSFGLQRTTVFQGINSDGNMQGNQVNSGYANLCTQLCISASIII